jgi:hypothetical protein
MVKKRLIAKDSDYFRDSEETIKLEYCPSGGNTCRLQMTFMNEKLLLARKFAENKEPAKAVDAIKEAFDSTYDLVADQCQVCARLFRETITESLNLLIREQDEMRKGFFRKRRTNIELRLAINMLQEMLEKNK